MTLLHNFGAAVILSFGAALFLSSCRTVHPGDQEIVYVACKNLPAGRAIELCDVAELKRDLFVATNDLHRIEDFIGKAPQYEIEAGDTINDLNISLNQKAQYSQNEADRNNFSESLPVIRTTSDIRRGGILCRSNVTQSMLPRGQAPDNVMTATFDKSWPMPMFIALKALPKGTVVSYQDLVDNSVLSNTRRFVASKDLAAGAVLEVSDLTAVLDKDDELERGAAMLDGDPQRVKSAFQNAYEFNHWYNHKLLKPLKQNQPLTDEALGPLMIKLAFAAHDLKPGVALKKEDFVLNFVEQETKSQKQEQDIDYVENAIGYRPLKVIRKGVKVTFDDLEETPIDNK